MLEAQGWMVGDNQPYSGRDLNYTMNRHAEGNDIPYLGLEIRQDGIADSTGVERWATHLEPVIRSVRDKFAGAYRLTRPASRSQERGQKVTERKRTRLNSSH